MKSILFAFPVVLCCSFALFAADAQNPKPDERFKADLLVVVAHPDDETEIGAYLARAIFDEKKRVAVVYGTHGNSGGNAVGQEQAASLGAIREIEGRRALAYFGVTNVWFLNGPDTPGQDVLRSLETWNHGDSLGRLVRLIRLTRPSVIATWLPDYVAGENHGDHQAAGVIATEAFDLAGDPTVFAEQVTTPRDRWDIGNLTEGLRPWQAEKIYYFSDTAHTEILKGKGPAYTTKDVSPARNKSYARLAAEECAFHLTQGDSGQMAKTSLEKNDLHYFEQPVLFVFGKSYVKSSTTGDLFEGVLPEGIPLRHAPGFTLKTPEAPVLEFGGPWQFYRSFWQAHGLEHLAGITTPEMMVNYSSFFTIPVSIENPQDKELKVDLAVDLPEGWTFVKRPPASFSVGPRESYSFSFQGKTPASGNTDWKTITITAHTAGTTLGAIRLRTELNSGALPQ